MKMLLAAASLLLPLCTFGCATTKVTIPVWRAPELDASGMRRIAVADLQGPAPHAGLARDVLAAELVRRNYEVPDAQTTRELLPAVIPFRGHNVDVRLLVEQARRAGFDGLLVGEVTCEGDADSSVTIGNPLLRVAVQTQLIDVRTGNVRGAAESHRSRQGRLSRRDEAKNSKREVYATLAREAARETAAKLAATSVDIEVPLAEPHDKDDGHAMQAGAKAVGRESAAGCDQNQNVNQLWRSFSSCRVGWGLPMLQADVCVLCFHLVSRWCHNISAIHQLHPSPSQNRTSRFPTSGSSLKRSGLAKWVHVTSNTRTRPPNVS